MVGKVDAIIAAYRRVLDRVGGEAAFYRAPGTTFSALLHIYGLSSSDTVASGSSVRRTAIVLAEDLINAGFPLPFQAKVDRIVSDGQTFVIMDYDDETRSVDGQVIAYELTLMGA